MGEWSRMHMWVRMMNGGVIMYGQGWVWLRQSEMAQHRIGHNGVWVVHGGWQEVETGKEGHICPFRFLWGAGRKQIGAGSKIGVTSPKGPEIDVYHKKKKQMFNLIMYQFIIDLKYITA